MDNEFETENLEEISYDHVERILNNRRRRMDEKLFRSHQNRIAIRAVLVAVLCVVIVYFALPISHIQAIRITGSHFLSEQYIAGYRVFFCSERKISDRHICGSVLGEEGYYDGDYFVIDSYGDLKCFDWFGYICTFQKIQ